MHSTIDPDRGRIASYIDARAFAPHVRAALEGLGYSVVCAITRGTLDDAKPKAAVRLVDERHYERIPTLEADPETPIVLVCSQRPRSIVDARIAGRVGRPVELCQLYPLLQRVLEPNPRTAPRVPTLLSARAIRRDRRAVGRVLSLSSGGCFFHGQEPIPSGVVMSLQFALPEKEMVSTRALCVHSEPSGAGLVFADAPREVRRNIDSFVVRRLAALA